MNQNFVPLFVTNNKQKEIPFSTSCLIYIKGSKSNQIQITKFELTYGKKKRAILYTRRRKVAFLFRYPGCIAAVATVVVYCTSTATVTATAS